MKSSPSVNFIVQPRSTLSKVIRLPLDLDDEDDNLKVAKALQMRLTNAIGFTVTNGPWKSPAFLNAKETITGDLFLNNPSNKLPVVSMTVSQVSK